MTVNEACHRQLPSLNGRELGVAAKSVADPVLTLLAFVIPATLFQDFRVVGRLFLPELALLALLPWLLTHEALSRVPRWLVVLGVAWLVGQVTTDAVQGSAFGDYARGWSKIAFTIANAVALCLLLNGHPRRQLLFGLGLAVGVILQYYFNPGIYALGDPWKFGVGWAITMVAVLLVSQGPLFRVPLVAPLVLAIMAFVNLGYGFRSLAGVCFLSGAYLLFQLVVRTGPSWHPRVSFRRLVLVSAFGVAASAMFMQVYSSAVQGGLLGLDAQRKYEQQAGGAWGLIVGGRSEALVSTQAILDSPVIGHGSWAKDSRYTELLAERLARYGYRFAPGRVQQEPDLIPTHSYLLGAWVEAGVLGGLFWAVVLLLAVAVLANLHAVRVPLSPLIAFAAFAFTWDIAFSPYGALARLTAPFYLVVLLSAWQQMRESSHDQMRPLSESPREAMVRR